MLIRVLFAWGALLVAIAVPAKADPIEVRAGAATYIVDPATLQIDARDAQNERIPLMRGTGASGKVGVRQDGASWFWMTQEGQAVQIRAEGDSLHISVAGKPNTQWTWAMGRVSEGTWIVPDGEGMAFDVNDPFWRSTYNRNRCMGGTTALSFPAWAHLTNLRSVTYALDDGFQSKLCVQDADGLQANLWHEFGVGSEKLELLIRLGEPDPLAPALFYRQYLKEKGRLQTFADKNVKDMGRLFGAPHVYVWGDGRGLNFLDDVKALGIDKLVISYDQDPRTNRHIVGPDYLRKAHALGYLAGPYEAFDNGQPEKTADMPSAIWGADLYPSGCLRDAKGEIVVGYGNRGCYMSSKAIADHPKGFIPAKRYAAHRAGGASQVFVDVDAFGTFYDDFSSDHRMNKAEDRQNRLKRLEMGIKTFDLVQGSENVTAWSVDVAHYSHGTGQAHTIAVWPLLSDKRFNGYWPPDRPPVYFGRFTPTAEEARALFGPADRLPLFEAVYHDDLVSIDRWEFSLTKVAGLERLRYARALLYGNPTIWNLDRKDLGIYGQLLKRAYADFQALHGVNSPVALTRFEWLSSDRLVQRVYYADGRVLTANFGSTSWQGIGPQCVKAVGLRDGDRLICPPSLPAQ